MATVNPTPELKHVQETLERLAAAVVHQMSALHEAAMQGNVVELEAIVARDRDIDALELNLDKISRAFLELRAPLGPDFRYVLGALDIAKGLERIGDCIEYVARHVTETKSLATDFPEAWALLDRMMERCQEILGKAFTSWQKSDAKLAKQIPDMDDFVDALQDQLYDVVIKGVRGGKQDVEVGMMVMLITNKLESLADIACHIAETVVFMILAKQIRHEGKKATEVTG